MSTQFTNRQWRLPNNENKDKQSNYSMDFDSASSDYINVGNPTELQITGALTISAWVKINLTSPTQVCIVSKDDVTNRSYDLWGRIAADGFPRFVIYNSNTGYSVSGTTDLKDNQWHHIVAVFTPNTSLKIYIDNVLEATNTTSIPSSIDNDPANFEIGRFGFGTYPMDGQIDAVSIYNYALSSSQITTLYGSSSTGIGNPMSLSPKPVAYYPLGDQDAFNGANYLVPNSSLKDYVFDFIPNDYIDCGTGSRFNIDQITISAWVNLSSGLTNTQIIAGIRNNTLGGGSICYQLQNQASGKFRFVISQSNGTYVDSVANDVHQYNTWYHVLGVADGSNIKLYVNGNLQTIVSSYDGTIYSPNENFNIGRQSSPSNYYWDGELSNVSVFNTALPATGSNSVETLYNNGSPLTSMTGFTSLVGWWKLDASATFDSSTNTWTIPDDSTNSNDGTSSGMTQANLVQSDLSFTSGYSPYALDFDGADDYISAGRVLGAENTSTLSVSFWLKIPSIGAKSYLGYFIGNFGAGWLIEGGTTSIGFALGDTTTGYQSFTLPYSGNIIINTWYHITMVFDGTQTGSANILKVYINGTQKTLSGTPSFPSSIPTLDATAEFTIGGIKPSTVNGAKTLSNVSVWNTALTSAQVTEIYNEGVPSNLNNHSAYSNLVSWWQLGSNTSWVDPYWIALDEKGTNNGQSQNVAAPNNMGESAIVDGVGSYANGVGTSGLEVIGSAPFSDANSLSINMDVLDRVEDTPS